MENEIDQLCGEIDLLRTQNEQLTAALDALERKLDAARTDSRNAEAVGRRQVLRVLGTAAVSGVAVTSAVLGEPHFAAAAPTDPLVEGSNSPDGSYVVDAALSSPVLDVRNSGAASAIAATTTASSSTAVTARGVGAGVSASAVDIGVDGAGLTGVRATGGGLVAGAGIGLVARGPQANARFTHAGVLPWKRAVGPANAAATFEGGELIVDEDGRWWACVKEGSTLESWRMLASAESAGSFVAVIPERFYDSRISGNRLAADKERKVDLPSSVPEGVRAVHVNVTVTDTIGAGYLALFPGDSLWPGTSTVNWFADNQFVANAITVRVGSSRQLTLRAGTNATNIVLDLYGYHR